MHKMKAKRLAILFSGLVVTNFALAQQPRPVITFESELATVFGSEGMLKVSISGFYIGNKIEPEHYLVFESIERCSGPERSRECHQTMTGDGFESVAELISALEAAELAFDGRQQLSKKLKLCERRCVRETTFEVAVEPRARMVQLKVNENSMGAYSISLDQDNSLKLLEALRFSERLQRHLAPQFDAFNAAKPNSEAGLSLDRL
jgi:hypothetical protein